MTELLDLVQHLNTCFQNELPGRNAHLRMVPRIRQAEFPEYPDEGIKSSVLLLLYPHNASIYTVLIRRPVYDGVHSGQIALPGGKYKDEDGDLLQTALRESCEEVGIDPAQVSIIGALTTLLIPPSKFLLTPYVGYSLERPSFCANAHEVAEIIETDIHEISDKNLSEKEISVHGGRVFTTAYYDIQQHVVWGATGMILAEFSELIRNFNR